MKISLKNSKVSNSNSFFNQRRLSQKITLMSYQNQNLEYLSSDYFESQPTDWVFPCTTKSTLLRFWKLSDDLLTLVKEKSPLSCMQCGIFPVSCDTINLLLIKTHIKRTLVYPARSDYKFLFLITKYLIICQR